MHSDTMATLSEKITNAKLAQKKWKRISLNEKIEFINKFNEIFLSKKSEFVELLISEIFKPKTVAEDEVVRTFDMTNAFCEEARGMRGEIRESGGYPGYKNNKIAMVGRQPLGTVLCISPFNYPINESLAKIIPALLMGNAVLFKPASCVLEIGELIEKCFREAEFQDGIFNLLVIPAKAGILNNNNNGLQDPRLRGDDRMERGDERVGSGNDREKEGNNFISNGIMKQWSNVSLIDFVVSHPLVDAINFTGSTETAEHIASICGIKKLTMGLSGKDASIVLSDCDLDHTVSEIVSGAFSYSGQRCTGVKKVLVQDGILEEFVKKLKLKMEMTLISGKLTDEKTNFGPVLLEKHADFIDELILDAKEMGAKVEEIKIMGAEFGKKEWGRRFILPMIVTVVPREMRIDWEEPFAPILPIVSFKSVEEAIKMVNQSAYGLQNSVFTLNINLALKIADELESGVVNINGKDARGPDNFPFLGIKKSGIGVVGGISYLLQEMSTIKSVVINKN
jgi:glyceraldehyde-3-phosphate dehydrogenase (NADP+)